MYKNTVGKLSLDECMYFKSAVASTNSMYKIIKPLEMNHCYELIDT